MKFKKVTKGHYESEDGRFETSTRTWVLFDSEHLDQFEQPITQRNNTLRGAKLDAKRKLVDPTTTP